MRLKRSFATITLTLTAALTAIGCSNNPYEVKKAEGQTSAQPARFKAESLAEGDFILNLKNSGAANFGLYRLTLPKEDWHTPNDVPCAVIKNGNASVMSCDWVAAHGLGKAAQSNPSTAPVPMPVPTPKAPQ